ncbi:TerC family protein [Planococcus chinensis]|uniref:TerC family protein n=1 Tax=Planococcus chinensis TaxID=272917 RepID=A0ABW4QIS3_9BACL
MDTVLLEYLWVLLVLIGLEGILAADNAVVMAVMVDHLPKHQKKKALFYGLAAAFVFRFAALFVITLLVDLWQIQAFGAVFVLFVAFRNLFAKKRRARGRNKAKPAKGSGFWVTVLKIELADIAFAVDSMLAAFALALTLPPVGDVHLGGLNGAQFLVMLVGGLTGVVLLRFAAHKFVGLLEKSPYLETTAFVIVGWVGVKYVVMTLSHEEIQVLPHVFPHSLEWTLVFWGGMLIFAFTGVFIGWRRNRL